MTDKDKTPEQEVAPETGEVEKVDADSGATESAEPEELSEPDQIVADAIEEYGSAVAALEMLTEARAKDAREAHCHIDQLPETHGEFVLRRKLATAAMNERKGAAERADVSNRRNSRERELAGQRAQHRRNKEAGLAIRKARAASQLASPPPTHGGKGEEEHTKNVLAADADAREERKAGVEKSKEAHAVLVEEGRKVQAAKALERGQGPEVVTNKAAIPANLDRLNLNALRALAKAHGLTVAHGDGHPGEPRKADYITALSVA